MLTAEQEVPEMKSAPVIRWLLMLLMVAIIPGCATSALLDADTGVWHQPATNGTVRLFRDGETREFVVLYGEQKDSKHPAAARERAYLLYQSEGRLEKQRSPRFVEIQSTNRLMPVPVFLATNYECELTHGNGQFVLEPCLRLVVTNDEDQLVRRDDKWVLEAIQPFITTNCVAGPSSSSSLPPVYAILWPDKRSFSIYSSGIDYGSHMLPVYKTGAGEVVRKGLIPLAVVADSTIVVGAVAGVLYAWMHSYAFYY
jgi:hypothetical protein